MQSWFSSSGQDQLREKPSSSLLADWNSYAATSDANESTNGLRSFGSLDLEAAVRSANDTVSGTLNVGIFWHLHCVSQSTKNQYLIVFDDDDGDSTHLNVSFVTDGLYDFQKAFISSFRLVMVSKGVRDIPGNFHSATSNIPSGKAIITHTPEVCNLFYTWLWLYHRVFLCTQGSQESTCSHVIKREASIYLGIHRQYGGHPICFHGVAQLCSLCALLCDTASATTEASREVTSTDVLVFCLHIFSFSLSVSHKVGTMRHNMGIREVVAV
ncbi:hypothetical protein OIU78_017456 [Salix suchowensis]|nr:hypothetical protein OIU78_017456 [Salix suchowensis]